MEKNAEFSSSVPAATFQELARHLWLVSPKQDSAEAERFHPRSTFSGTAQLYNGVFPGYTACTTGVNWNHPT